MLKKTILAALTGTLLASGAAFADRGDRHDRGDRYDHGRRDVMVKHEYRPAYRPVVVQRHYYPQPVVVERHVVVQQPVVVHRPEPVYYQSYQSADPGAGLAILAGAAIGGAIAYHIANGN